MIGRRAAERANGLLADIGGRLGADIVAVSRHVGDRIRLQYQWTSSEAVIPPAKGGRPANGWPQFRLRLLRGEPVVVEDCDALGPGWAGEQAFFERVGMRTAMFVPIDDGDQIVGNVAVMAKDPRRWQAGDDEAIRIHKRSLLMLLSAVAPPASSWTARSLENVPLPMAVLDVTGAVVSANPAFQRLVTAPGHVAPAVDRPLSHLEPSARERLRLTVDAVTRGSHPSGTCTISLWGHEVETRVVRIDSDDDFRAVLTLSPNEGAVALDHELDAMTALANGWLRVEYQPIVDVDGHGVVGAEALLRCDHPELGPVEPLALLRSAEGAGEAAEIDRFVLTRAVDELGHLLRGEGFLLAVNLSPGTLLAGSVTDLVDTVAHSGVDPRRVQFELLERSELQRREVVDDVERLRRVGFRVALDNFGTGHAALAVLARVHVDAVKIDRTLIRDAHGSRRARLVLHRVAAMIHELSMDLIVEGVELPADELLARSLRAVAVQGRRYGPPMDATTLAAFVADWVPVVEALDADR